MVDRIEVFVRNKTNIMQREEKQIEAESESVQI